MKQLAKVEILRTNGAREEHQVGKHILSNWIRRMIGAEVTDSVNLRDGRVMIVDDHGWDTNTRTEGNRIIVTPTQALKPINAQATELYWSVCRPGTTHQIAGDVAIAFDEDFA